MTGTSPAPLTIDNNIPSHYHADMGKESRRKRQVAGSEPYSAKEADEASAQNSIKGSHHLLSILLIVVISLAIYSNTLKNGFVYDDETTIVNSTLIKSLSNLPKLFSTEYFVSSGEMSYRPVVTFTYFIDYAIYSMKPWGYHLTNILLHAINGVILYFFLVLLIPEEPRRVGSAHLSIIRILANQPIVITLLFVSHPALTEAVNAISFREDLLAFMFYISAFSIFLYIKRATDHRPSTIGLYALSCLLFFLALLSKEMAITLPLIIFCYEWIYSKKEEKRLSSILLDRHNIGYIVVALIYLVIRFYLFYYPVEENVTAWMLSERLLTIPWLILKYVMLLIAPASLSADYVIPPIQTPFSPLFIFSFVIVGSCIVFLLRMKKRNEGITFGLLFLLITLMPVYNIIPIVNQFAERYIYLPALGFTLIAGSSIHLVMQKRKKGTGTVYLSIITAAILVVYSVGVVKRNVVWKDNFSLWMDTVVKVPESSKAHNNAGYAYHYLKGQIDNAIKEYLYALKLKPEYPEAHYNLGNAYSALRQIDTAVSSYLAAIRFNPDYVQAHGNLGSIYYVQGRIDEAIKEYLAAIRINPNYVDAHYNLGDIYLKQNRLDEALQEFKSVIRFNPNDPDAHYNVGIIYKTKGLKDASIMEFTTALQLKPDFIEAQQALISLE